MAEISFMVWMDLSTSHITGNARLPHGKRCVPLGVLGLEENSNLSE